MRLKTKLLLVAVPTAAVISTGALVVLGLHFRKLRRKQESSFLPSEVRGSLEELCLVKAEDFAPDKFGSSRYQRKLESLTDRQLIGVYVVINAAKVLRDRGVDPRQLSKEDVIHEVSQLRNAVHGKHDRRELIKRLGSFGVDTARSMLDDGLLLAGMATQAA